MKIFYFSANIFMFFLILILGYLNFSFRPKPENPLLGKTPSVPDFSETVKNKFVFRTGIVKGVSAISEDNLFSPFRAKEEGEIFPSLKATGFELVGVFKYGDEAGALIIEKAGNAPSVSSSRLPQGTIRSAQPAQADQPVFYRINDILPNGFLLKEVNPDSVMLVRGKEQIILQIDFDDEGSLKRGEAGSSATKNGPIIIQSQSGQQKAPPGREQTLAIPPPKEQPDSRVEAVTPSGLPSGGQSDGNQREPEEEQQRLPKAPARRIQR